MTNYVDTLSAADKDIYLKGLGNFPDPFSLKDGWTNDPKQWPPISYLDIVTYFVLSTNLYSLQQTKAFRSLEAYLYATEGHVQEVHHVQKDKLTLLLADVLPSQRQGKKTTMYKAFLIVDADGQIKTAHCTCMAGNGKACSHAAAIAFKVEFAVRLGLSKTTPTDELCKWNGTAKKQEEQINAEYKARVLSCHPDKHPTDKEAHLKFSRLSKAKLILLDPEKRKDYDKWRNSQLSMSYDQWCARPHVKTSMHWGVQKTQTAISQPTGGRGSEQCKHGSHTHMSSQERESESLQQLREQMQFKHRESHNPSQSVRGWQRDNSIPMLQKFRNYEI